MTPLHSRRAECDVTHRMFPAGSGESATRTGRGGYQAYVVRACDPGRQLKKIHTYSAAGETYTYDMARAHTLSGSIFLMGHRIICIRFRRKRRVLRAFVSLSRLKDRAILPGSKIPRYRVSVDTTLRSFFKPILRERRDNGCRSFRGTELILCTRQATLALYWHV